MQPDPVSGAAGGASDAPGSRKATGRFVPSALCERVVTLISYCINRSSHKIHSICYLRLLIFRVIVGWELEDGILAGSLGGGLKDALIRGERLTHKGQDGGSCADVQGWDAVTEGREGRNMKELRAWCCLM